METIKIFQTTCSDTYSATALSVTISDECYNGPKNKRRADSERQCLPQELAEMEEIPTLYGYIIAGLPFLCNS